MAELMFDGCWSSLFVSVDDVDLDAEPGVLPAEFAPLRLLDRDREKSDRLSLQVRTHKNNREPSDAVSASQVAGKITPVRIPRKLGSLHSISTLTAVHAAPPAAAGFAPGPTSCAFQPPFR